MDAAFAGRHRGVINGAGLCEAQDGGILEEALDFLAFEFQ
jgi:hypothetical protein